MGAIATAIVQILDQTTSSLRPVEIHALVERRLQRAISRDTVISHQLSVGSCAGCHVADRQGSSRALRVG
jgi:hypothetical protein